MSRYSFIQFSGEIDDCGCCLALPVSHGSDLAFFCRHIIITEIHYCTPNGDTIKNVDNPRVVGSFLGYVFIFVELNDDLSLIFAKGDCFRLKILDERMNPYYSNLFTYIGCKEGETSVLKYRCDTDEFDFHYSLGDDLFNKIRLPLRIFNAQYPQEDEVYITREGKRKVMFAKVDKEWELETDYLPEEWHEKIIVALSHDVVYIDDERVQRTEPYQLDWDSVLETDCTDAIKGRAKVQQNKTVRNSNCG